MPEFVIESIAVDVGDSSRLYLFGEDREVVVRLKGDDAAPLRSIVSLSGRPWNADAESLAGLVAILHERRHRVSAKVDGDDCIHCDLVDVDPRPVPVLAAAQRSVAKPKARTLQVTGTRTVPPPADGRTYYARNDAERRVKIPPPGSSIIFDSRRKRVVPVNGEPFANPFTLETLGDRRGKNANANTSLLIMLYQRWIRGDDFKKFEANLTEETIARWPELEERRRALIGELKRRLYPALDAGFRVGCHCNPDDSCHADVLVALWKERWTEGSPLE